MNKQQLASKIWESANKMRSKIEANEYKDYILGFIFYKFLSETEVARLKARDFAEEDLPSLVEDDEETVDFVKGECGYFIAYENLFSSEKNRRKTDVKICVGFTSESADEKGDGGRVSSVMELVMP